MMIKYIGGPMDSKLEEYNVELCIGHTILVPVLGGGIAIYCVQDGCAAIFVSMEKAVGLESFLEKKNEHNRRN